MGHDAMTVKSRKSRIVRRLALTSIASFVLLCWYIGLWMTVCRARTHNIMSYETAMFVRPVFAPLIGYCNSELPGSTGLSDFWWSINPEGAGETAYQQHDPSPVVHGS